MCFGFRISDFAWRTGGPPAVLFLAAFAAALVAGCGLWGQRKPELYRVSGRVVDGGTMQGLSQVNVLLRVAVDTSLGPRVLTNYGFTRADGTYDVELSEGFEVVRYATRVRLDAAKRGYLASGTEIPVPTVKQPVYKVPDLVLSRASPRPLPAPGRGE